MTSKSVSTTRIAVRWAVITGATAALFASIGEATSVQPERTAPRIVNVASPSSPDAAMDAAVDHCAAAPRDVRQACWSLYLRPAFRDVVSGKVAVAECLSGAREEVREYPGKGVYAGYVRGCVLGNLETP